jgi:hypothetical protein
MGVGKADVVGSLKAALHDAITEASQVCKLLATSYLSFVNIYFLEAQNLLGCTAVF